MKKKQASHKFVSDSTKCVLQMWSGGDKTRLENKFIKQLKRRFDLPVFLFVLFLKSDFFSGSLCTVEQKCQSKRQGADANSPRPKY